MYAYVYVSASFRPAPAVTILKSATRAEVIRLQVSYP